MSDFYMMIGGEGRSIIAKQILDELNQGVLGRAILISKDAARAEIAQATHCDDVNNGLLIDAVSSRIRKHLLAGQHVIYDAENLNWKARRTPLEQAYDADNRYAYVFMTEDVEMPPYRNSHVYLDNADGFDKIYIAR